MQLNELLSSSVSQCNFVLVKTMENIIHYGFCMTGLVYPFWPCSHFINGELLTAYGWSPSCDDFISRINVRRICLLKFSSVVFTCIHP